MKIKYNIPMLNEIKSKINNIKLKMNNRKEKNEKVPIRYYTLLVLMLAIGTVTFTTNAKKYSDINSENYIKYTLDNNIEVDSNKIENVMYETAVSSISTNISNMETEDNYKQINLKNEYIWPVNGVIIKEQAINTLAYSKTLDMWRVHPGIDIAVNFEESVKAIQDGIIIDILEDDFYGNTIKIQHDNGYISVYSNLFEIQGLQKGVKIKQGDIIGKVGVSAYGEVADESHLHFEILSNNEWINPIEILE